MKCEHKNTHPNRCDDCGQPYCGICITYHESCKMGVCIDKLRAERDEMRGRLAAACDEIMRLRNVVGDTLRDRDAAAKRAEEAEARAELAETRATCHLETVGELGVAMSKQGKELVALAALVGEMREAIKAIFDNCGCDPESCSNCQRAEAALSLPAPAALEALTRRIRGEVETNLALWTDERVKTFRAGVERLTRAEVWREAVKYIENMRRFPGQLAADRGMVSPLVLCTEFERRAAEEGK